MRPRRATPILPPPIVLRILGVLQPQDGLRARERALRRLRVAVGLWSRPPRACMRHAPLAQAPRAVCLAPCQSDGRVRALHGREQTVRANAGIPVLRSLTQRGGRRLFRGLEFRLRGCRGSCTVRAGDAARRFVSSAAKHTPAPASHLRARHNAQHCARNASYATLGEAWGPTRLCASLGRHR